MWFGSGRKDGGSIIRELQHRPGKACNRPAEPQRERNGPRTFVANATRSDRDSLVTEPTSARRTSKHSGNDDHGADRRACLARGTIPPDDHDVVEKWMSTMSRFITTVYRLSTKRRDSLKAFLICAI